MATDDLTVSVQVFGPSGVIECEDSAGGYTLHADSFASEQHSHRKAEINSPWVEGTYAVDSVVDNTIEQLVVWVEGNVGDGTFSHALFRSRLNALRAMFDQLSFTIIRTIGDSVETWDCEVSDYTVETQQEFLVATRGVLRVPLSRRPNYTTLSGGGGGGGGEGGGGGGGDDSGGIEDDGHPIPGDWPYIYLPWQLGLSTAYAERHRLNVAGIDLGGWPL